MKIFPAGPAALVETVTLLKHGGLAIVPTETFYGIACDAWSTGAVGRLIEAKGRSEGKPIPLIAGSLGIVRSCIASEPPLLEDLARRFWPGPLTLVLPARPGLPQGVTGGTGTVGIRIPGPSFALDLARAMGGPLTATSANRAGKPAAESVDEVDPDFVGAVDLVVDGGRTPGGPPSTVLDITAMPPRIVREGALLPEVGRFLDKWSRRN